MILRLRFTERKRGAETASEPKPGQTDPTRSRALGRLHPLHRVEQDDANSGGVASMATINNKNSV